ncbi:MAG: signal peptidase I [Clostridia bacterium]|nr:signal peptidase I [Clostridia bacterium]
MIMKHADNRTKIRNRIISASVTVLLVLSLFCCLYVIVQVLTCGYVSFGGHCFFRVVTGSMEPSLSVGELILTDDVDIKEICVGDVVSFRSQSIDTMGNIITHRVVDVSHNAMGEIQLLTKGDANLSVDGMYVTASNLIGKVVWSSGDSFLASVMSFLSGRYGFLACIVFPCLLILGFVLKDNVKSMRRDMKKLVDTMEKSGEDVALVSSDVIAEEDYDAMRERLRAELMEELLNRDVEAQSREE